MVPINELGYSLNENKMSYSTISSISSSLFEPTVGKQLKYLVGSCKEKEKQKPKQKPKLKTEEVFFFFKQQFISKNSN